MIRKQLQRNDMKNRRKVAVILRQPNNVRALVGLNSGISIRKNVKLAARTNFLHIRFKLFNQLIVWRYRNNRHFTINECKRSMLKFASRIGLSMNIANFLEL